MKIHAFISTFVAGLAISFSGALGTQANAASKYPCETNRDAYTSTSTYTAYVPFRSTGYTYDCDLSYGNSGAAVRQLQYVLNNCYGFNLTVDGSYGTKTDQAVRGVQAARSIRIDGVYGPQTRNAMLWSVTNSAGQRWCSYIPPSAFVVASS